MHIFHIPGMNCGGCLHAVTRAIQALALADVAIDDVGLRRPTLDEVFLALTGRPATDDFESPSAQPAAA